MLVESQGKHHAKNRAESNWIRKPGDWKAIGSKSGTEGQGRGKLRERKATEAEATGAESYRSGKLLKRKSTIAESYRSGKLRERKATGAESYRSGKLQ
jgi:hypothetical protein